MIIKYLRKIFLIIYVGILFNLGPKAGEKTDDYISYEKEFIINNSFTDLIQAIRIVESGNIDTLVGPDQDTGPLQITPPRLNDYNKNTGKNYKIEDCFNFEISKEIFIFYANRIGKHKSNWEEISRRWNAASNYKGEAATIYWQKVYKHLK